MLADDLDHISNRILHEQSSSVVARGQLAGSRPPPGPASTVIVDLCGDVPLGFRRHSRFNQAHNSHHDCAPNPSTTNAGKNGRHV